ncbi:MAG TPA: tripartite tricarboxylate transporter TctB family protein [Selenomonadales bacterium]|nr:tripartite tricarboxylate transporter TctB family protein [Selenomonadales bacterium]
MYRNASLWAGAFFLVFSVIFFGTSLDYSYKSKLGSGIGPGFMPFWFSLLMVVSSVIYLGYALKKEKIDISAVVPDKAGLKNIGSLFLYMILFAAIVEHVGFIIANSLMLFLMFRGYFRWRRNLIISIGASVFLYWVFVILLSVPLPVNMFGW